MTRSRFSNPVKSSANSSKNSTSALPILQLLILGVSITILAAIFVQNLQPAVEIVFFGQKTLPIPLSVAMLIALVGGGLLAFGFNAIATWRQNWAIRRAVVAAGTNNKSPNPENTSNNSQNNISNDAEDEDEIDDWDEDWDDDEDEELDEDPDTVPYGDRAKMKSANTKSTNTRQVRDQRPPLDAKYIK